MNVVPLIPLARAMSAYAPAPDHRSARRTRPAIAKPMANNATSILPMPALTPACQRSRRHRAQTGTLREHEASVHDGHRAERIVDDEQVAVEVRPLDRRREMRRGRDRDARLRRSAAEHHLHPKV